MTKTKIARYGNNLSVRPYGTRLAAWLATVREPEPEAGGGSPRGNEVID